MSVNVKHNREMIWACAFAQALYDWGEAEHEDAWHWADCAVEAFDAEYARREALRYTAASVENSECSGCEGCADDPSEKGGGA